MRFQEKNTVDILYKKKMMQYKKATQTEYYNFCYAFVYTKWIYLCITVHNFFFPIWYCLDLHFFAYSFQMKTNPFGCFSLLKQLTSQIVLFMPWISIPLFWIRMHIICMIQRLKLSFRFTNYKHSAW